MSELIRNNTTPLILLIGSCLDATIKPHLLFLSPKETRCAICPIVVSKTYKGTYGRLRYYDLLVEEYE